jgi:autophagy-related protein 11
LIYNSHFIFSFKVGDLALLLPTRNSTGRPWAAFNINAPHYFLKSTENIAAQMQSREWIVARIVSITEYVTDEAVPESNPYGLGNGITYHLIEVENWRNNKLHPSKKRHVAHDSGLASIAHPREVANSSRAILTPSSVHSYNT